MVQLPRRPTRFQRLATAVVGGLKETFAGGWARTSLRLLALLGGFYFGGNITAIVLPDFPGGRPSMVLALVVLLELVVRVRTRALPPLPDSRPVPFLWMLADNLRLGLVYALVLEAFKLGT
ncbi:MAG: DUF565 domain-containing protein [Cyanobacteriota bacterium]|nr:DUF565 domain-containing protein [Cyanobacteriota bacterium]